MPSPARPRRPHVAPRLVSHVGSPSTASLASPALSADFDALPHSPSTSRGPRGAAHRSPSALSLASTRSGGRPATRSASAASKHTRRTTLSQQAVPTGSAREDATDEDDASDGTPSRASSSSSLDGLAARLRGARDGKGKARAADVDPEPAVDEAPSRSPPSSSGARERTAPDERAHRADAPSSDVHPLRGSFPSSSARSIKYDLPRILSTSALATATPASPSDTAAFRRAISPSSSIVDPDDDDVDDLEGASGVVPRKDANADSASLVSLSRSDAHPDPRSLLRAQLARAPSRRDGDVPRAREKDLERDKHAPSLAAGLIRRRYFILSTAGKLVYTSDEGDEAATGLVGVMQAIVSIFADDGDKLRYIDAGPTRISFLLKAPLYLVVVSSFGEPESVLRMHLDYLYLQVLSVVTLAQLQAIFARRSNFDLRRMMEGTEPFFHSLTSALQTSLPILLSSIEVYRLAPAVREELSRALDPGKAAVQQLDLLYVLLLCRGRLVTLLRPKRHSIHPTDLHLLLSTVYAPRPSPTGARPSPLTEPGAETWLPVCLPRFNAQGFLHAYVSFLPPADGTGGGETGLVLLSSQRDAFNGVRAAASSIRTRLTTDEALHALEMAAPQQAYSLGELAVPGLRHFVYKDRGLVQVTRGRWEGEYAEEEGGEGERARMRLVTLYQHLHDALHPRPAAAGTAFRPPAQVQYLRTEHETVLGWVTPQFELYLATSPLLPHSAVVSAARAVSRWVKKDEKGLFLHAAGTF